MEVSPPPPPEAREKMMLKVKELFSEEIKTEVSPWVDLAASLWGVVQQLPLFNEERMMVKIKDIDEDRASGQFKCRVLVIKRPQFYPNWIDPFFADWSDPESDDESGDVEIEQVFFCIQVTVNLIKIDTLEKASALVVTKMKNPESLTVCGKPMPKKILSIVHNLTSKNLED